MGFLSIKESSKLPADNSDIVRDSMNLNDTMILLNKFKVDKLYFEIVESNFNEIYPFLLRGVEYTAEDLIGAELWTGLTRFGQRHAHLCLKHLTTLPGACLTDMSFSAHDKMGFQIVNK